jgi:hypothetical protein
MAFDTCVRFLLSKRSLGAAPFERKLALQSILAKVSSAIAPHFLFMFLDTKDGWEYPPYFSFAYVISN